MSPLNKIFILRSKIRPQIIASVQLLVVMAVLHSQNTQLIAQRITLSKIAAKSDVYSLADEATIQKVIAAVEKLPMIKNDLTDGTQWLIYRGNLTFDHSVYLNFPLIVEGDLIIRGYYDDYSGSEIGSLVVLGDMKAEHVFTWGPMAVTGSVVAKEGLILAHYNDFTFEVAGKIEARALLIDDKSSDYNDVQASVHIGSDGPKVNSAEMLRLFQPETLIESYAGEFEEEYESDWFAEQFPSHDVCTQLLDEGKPIFRKTVAPKSLLEKVKRALALDTPPGDLAAIAASDPLVSAIVASREDIPKSLQDQLINRADPMALAQLAQNPTVTQQRLGRIAATSEELMQVIAGHPNAPESSLTMAAASEDPETRVASLQSSTISLASYRRLIFDKDASVRRVAIYHRLIHQLIFKTVQDREDLSSKHLEMLGRFSDPLCREDWGLTAIYCPTSTRDLVRRGIQSWYNDEPEILHDVQSLARHQDDAWWTALASSQNEDLQEIAARNIHTPVTALQKMAADNADNESLLNVLLLNRRMPLDHPIYQKHPTAKISHPAIEAKELELLLKRNLRDGDSDDARSKLIEAIAARKLRDPAIHQ